MSKSRELILFVLLAMLALPLLQLASPVSALAQTNDDAELLAGYVSQTQDTAPEAGPLSGTLALDGGPDNTESLNVELADQVIHLDFQVPQVDAGGLWAVAAAFRYSSDQFHFFLYWSDGGWSYSPAGGGNAQSGDAPTPGAAGTAASIDIATLGAAGYVGINGEYTTTLDLSSKLDAGDVVISANLIGTFDAGDEPVSFSNFTVWPLSPSGPAAEASPTTRIEASPAASPATPADPAPAAGTVTAQTEIEPATPTATTQPEPSPAAATVTAQTGPVTAEPTAAAQDDPAIQPDSSLEDEAAFNRLVLATASEPVIFGPVDDVLTHDPESVAFYPANLSVTDFAIQVECIGTVAVADGFWDCGIAFRDTETAEHYRVAYISDGYWFLSIGAGEPLLTGTDAPVSAVVGDTVTLNLIVSGADGYFGIDGEYLARFDLSELPGPGSVDVASAFFNDTYIEGGALEFEDFIVWSLDAATPDPEPTATGQAVVEETPTTAGGATVVPPATIAGTANVDGTTYTSPTYGYSQSWNDSWTVDSDTSDETGDYLGLNNGVVLADLIGEQWEPSEGSCFDRLVNFYSFDLDYSDLQFASDTVSANPGIWDITGILTVTYTDPKDGSVTDYINYASCSQLPADAIVSLEQFVPVSEFRAQVDAMDELRASFDPNTGMVIVEETPTSVVVEASPTAVAVVVTPTAGAGSPNVVGDTYTSPTFGYSLTWDDTYEVEIDQSESSVDYLRVTNGTITVDLFAAVGDNSPAECIDELLLFYENDPLYSDVQFVTDAQDQPLTTTGDGFATTLISFTTVDDDGVESEQFDYFTCTLLEEQGAVLVFEIFTSPSEFVLQSEAISALQEGLLLPGSSGTEPPVVLEQTPVVGPTAAAVEGTVVPPPIEEALTATFLLAPIGESGVQGTGTLEGQARQVTLTAIVIGGTPGDLVTIHRGSCDSINPIDEPDYIAGELDESGLLREDVPVRLTVLVTGDAYSVVIYSGGDDFSMPLACGEIGNR